MKKSFVLLGLGLVLASHAHTAPMETLVQEAKVPADAPKTVWFPPSDIYPPVLADPKQQQFFMSFVKLQIAGNRPFTAWLVGFGETIGLVRWKSSGTHNGWQLSLLAGLFSQFNWNTPSKDLINSDYTFGTSLSWRRDSQSARFRILHQSSHLGDEFLINNRPNRINLSFEAFEGLFAQEWRFGRLYGGGGVLLTRDPSDLKRNKLQGGFEMSGKRLSGLYRFARPVLGLDVSSKEQNKWTPNYSMKAGFEIGKPSPGGRQVRILGEYYKGYSPFGQFYDTRIEYAGVGIYFGL